MGKNQYEPDFSSDEADSQTEKNQRCGVCGEEYGQPILAEIFSDSSAEKYYACSRCLSKVEAAEKISISKDEVPTAEEEHTEADEVAMEKIEVEVKSSCQHKLGYLKKRDRSSPIPDECLICTRMIECM